MHNTPHGHSGPRTRRVGKTTHTAGDGHAPRHTRHCEHSYRAQKYSRARASRRRSAGAHARATPIRPAWAQRETQCRYAPTPTPASSPTPGTTATPRRSRTHCGACASGVAHVPTGHTHMPSARVTRQTPSPLHKAAKRFLTPTPPHSQPAAHGKRTPSTR